MAFEERLIKEVLETGNASLIAGKHGIHSSLVNRWIKTSKKESYKKLQNSAPASFQCLLREPAGLKSTLEQNQQLWAIIGKKGLEIVVLTDLLKKRMLLNHKLIVSRAYVDHGYYASDIFGILGLNPLTYYHRVAGQRGANRERRFWL